MHYTLLSQKYSIIQVLESTDGVNYYIAKKLDNDSEYLFTINEFYDREKIDEFIDKFLTFKLENSTNDFEEYFSENSKFYAVFKYSKGQNIDDFLKKEKLNFQYRLAFLKNILQSFLEYNDIPSFIKKSMLHKKNLTIKDNSIKFNYQIEPFKSIEPEKEIYKEIGNLISLIFTISEIEQDKKLGIVNDKCKKGIYNSIGEILKDLEDVTIAISKEYNIKSILDEKNKKNKKIMFAMIASIAVIIATFAFYKTYINYKNKTQYADVNNIGDINIKETQTNEYQVIEPETEELEKESNEVKQETNKEETDKKEIAEEYQVHFIKWGDTLYELCTKYYNNPYYADYIAQYNNIKNKNIIRAGKILKFPSLEYVQQYSNQK